MFHYYKVPLVLLFFSASVFRKKFSLDRKISKGIGERTEENEKNITDWGKKKGEEETELEIPKY